jgi:hypothetical protein
MSIARRLSMGLVLFVGLALLPTTAKAAPSVVYEDASGTVLNVSNITLAQLLSGFKIELNNGFDTKEITGVANSFSSGVTGSHATVIAAGDISVTGHADGGLNPGPGVTFANNFAAGLNSTQDTSWDFKVTVLNPGFLIHDISLSAAGAIHAGGQIVVTETATGNGVTSVMTNQVNPPGTSNTTDMALTPPATSLSIHKDVFVKGGTTDAGSTLTDLTQRFSQTSAVPEPSTMALAGLGALGFIGYGLRRRKASGA